MKVEYHHVSRLDDAREEPPVDIARASFVALNHGLIDACRFARDFADECAIAHEHAVHLAGEHARDPNLAVADAYELAREPDCARDRNTACSLADELDHADKFRSVLGRRLNYGCSVAEAYELAFGLGRRLGLALEHAGRLARDHHKARILRNIIARLHRLAASIQESLLKVSGPEPVEGTPAPPTVMVSPTARLVIGFTARLLPAAPRADKAEEFASELYALAEEGGSRSQQLGHAIRVLITIMSLRRALAAGGRRAAERV